MFTFIEVAFEHNPQNVNIVQVGDVPEAYLFGDHCTV